MKILVTGATGFVGTNLVDLLRERFKVVTLGRERVPSLENHLTLNFENDLISNCNFIPTDIDLIIHLAQADNHHNFPGNATNLFKVNVESTLQLMQLASKFNIPRVLIASTGSVYELPTIQHSSKLSIAESSVYPFYPITKLMSEYIALSYSTLVDVRIMRLFFPYGRGMKSTMLIPRLVDKVKNSLPILLDESGQGLVFNPIYIKDLCRFAIESIVSDFSNWDNKSCIDVSGLETLSLKDVCDELGRILRIQPVYEFSGSKKTILGDSSFLLNSRISVTNFKVGLQSVV